MSYKIVALSDSTAKIDIIPDSGIPFSITIVSMDQLVLVIRVLSRLR